MLRRWLRRIVFAVAVVVLVVVAAALVAVRTAPVRELLRDRVVQALAGMTDAEVRIGAIGGSVLHTLVVDDVRVVVGGRVVVRVPRIELAYSLLPLVRGELRLDRVIVHAPRVRAVRTAAGWQVPHMAGGRGEGGRRGALAIAVARLAIDDGRIAVALEDASPPRRLAATALALAASGRVGRERRRIDVASLRFVPRGIALSAVDAAASLVADADGRIELTRFDAGTSRTRVSASGVVARGRRVDVRVALAPLAARDVRAVAPDAGLLADVRARARARGPWHAIAGVLRADLGPGGSVGVRTTVDAAADPFRHATTVRLAAVDPGAVLARLPRATLNGWLRARGGVERDGPLAWRVALRDSRIAGRHVDRVDLRGALASGVHRVHAAVAAPLGEVAVAVRATLGPTPVYRATGRWTLARLDLVAPSLWGWATGHVRVAGRGTAPDARRARVLATLAGASVRGLPIDAARIVATLDGEAAQVAKLAVRGSDLRLAVDASGRADLARRSVELGGSAGADVGAVGRWLGTSLAGNATATFRAKGALDALAVDATATLDAPAYASASADRARADVTLARLGGPTPGGRVALAATRFRLGTGTRFDGTVSADWQRRGATDAVHLTLAATGEDGRAEEAAADVERAGALIRTTVQRLVVTPPDASPWRLARPATVTVDSAVATDGFEVVSGGQRVALAGRIAVRGGSSDATITLGAIALKPVCALAALPPCDGAVTGRVVVGGAPASPTVDASAGIDELRVGGVAYGRVDLAARYGDRLASIETTLSHPEAGVLHVAGRVPVDLAWEGPRRDLRDAPLAIDATADRLDLTIVAALAPGTVASSAGRLALEAHVTGTRAAPRVAGRVALDDGRFQLAAAGIPYEDVRARIEADGGRIVVREMQAKAGDGTASVSGAVVLERGADALDVRVRLDRFFAVRTESYEAAVSGDVAVRGALDAPDVSGTLAVDRALVRPAALPASGRSIPKDPTIEVVGLPGPPADEAGKHPASAIAKALTLAVSITIEKNAWIRRNDANIELAGKIDVTKARGEQPRIVGQIRLLRGWYVFQGRRFNLDQGTITFTGASPPKPIFDVTAIYKTQEYRIEIHITGSSDKPKLDLTSDPPLEQADVLSVVLFGKPAHQLGKGQSVALQQQALQLAAGYVMPELRTSVMNSLGLDTLEVEMPPEGTDTGPRVSAGRYVSEDVFVSLSQEFGRREGQAVGIEYDVGRNVSIRASTSTRGDSAIDLFWRHRY